MILIKSFFYQYGMTTFCQLPNIVQKELNLTALSPASSSSFINEEITFFHFYNIIARNALFVGKSIAHITSESGITFISNL